MEVKKKTQPYPRRPKYHEIVALIIDQDIGRRLFLARRNGLRMSQKQVADKLGIRQEAVSWMELGKTPYAPVSLGKMYDAYGRHMAFILSGSDYWGNYGYEQKKEENT